MSSQSKNRGEYDRMCTTVYNVDPISGGAIVNKVSKGSSKFQATQNLHQLGSRLNDGSDLLSETLDVLKSANPKKKHVKDVCRLINTSIIPLMSIAANASREAANIVSPIARSEYAHRREETLKKTAIEESSPNKKVKLTMVEDFVKSQTSPDNANTNSTKTNALRSQRKKPANQKKLPITITPPPEPRNGHTYGMGEFLEHYFSQKTRKERGAFIRAILEPPYRYVKRDRATCFRVINYHKAGKRFAFDEEWNVRGRRPILKEKELVAVAKKIMLDPTDKKIRDDINAMLVENEKNRGGAPASNKRFAESTIDNYKAALANKSGVSLIKTSVDNTIARFIAERSLISAMAFIIVVAMTHFYVTPQDDVQWREELNKLDDDERLLHDLVSKFHGNRPVRARPPHLIFNSDDTTDYICEGTQPNNSSEWGLAGTSALPNSGTLSFKHKDNSKKMSGRRIKRHFISGGRGDSAPPVYIIAGLSEYEMPNDDFLVMRIQRLCVGGFGVNGADGYGYVILLRDKKGMDRWRFEWIQKEVLIPFINKCRLEYDGIDVSLGGRIDEQYMAVFWCDGDAQQIAAITSEAGIQLLSEMGVIANKHNASRTGSEASQDLCKVFPVSKRINRNTTVVHIPGGELLLKGNIEAAFAKLWRENGLRIKKLPAIVDHLSKQLFLKILFVAWWPTVCSILGFGESQYSRACLVLSGEFQLLRSMNYARVHSNH